MMNTTCNPSDDIKSRSQTEDTTSQWIAVRKRSENFPTEKVMRRTSSAIELKQSPLRPPDLPLSPTTQKLQQINSTVKFKKPPPPVWLGNKSRYSNSQNEQNQLSTSLTPREGEEINKIIIGHSFVNELNCKLKNHQKNLEIENQINHEENQIKTNHEENQTKIIEIKNEKSRKSFQVEVDIEKEEQIKKERERKQTRELLIMSDEALVDSGEQYPADELFNVPNYKRFIVMAGTDHYYQIRAGTLAKLVERLTSLCPAFINECSFPSPFFQNFSSLHF